MLSYRQAERLAAAWVDVTTDGDAALLLEHTIDKPYGWVFFYDSRASSESGRLSDRMIGNAPFIVDRIDREIRGTGTGRPIEHYLKAYEASLPAARMKMTPERSRAGGA